MYKWPKQLLCDSFSEPPHVFFELLLHRHELLYRKMVTHGHHFNVFLMQKTNQEAVIGCTIRRHN